MSVMFFEGFKKGMHKFGVVISTVINSVLLLLVYFIGVGTSFLILKALNKKIMAMSHEKDRKSYWQDLNLGREKFSSYYKQF